MNYLNRLWQYVSRYKLRLIVGVIFGVVSAALNVASLPTIRGVFEILFKKTGPESFRAIQEAEWLGPLRQPAARAVDYLLSADPLKTLIIIMGLLVLLKVLQGLCRGLQEYLTCYVAGRATIDISNALYGNVIELPVAFFSRARNSQIMSRFANDMTNVERGLDTLFGKAIREPLNLVGYLFYCFWIAPGLTLVSMVVLPFVAVAVVLLARKAHRGARKALQSKARLLGILSESLAGIRIVKVFHGDEYEKERFENENRTLFRQVLRMVKAEAATGPLVEFFLFLGGALVIVVSGYYVVGGRLEPDQVLILFVALGMALDPLRKLANVNTRYQQTKTGAQRVFEYMDEKTEELAAAGSVDIGKLRHSIRFEDVSFSYDGSSPVLTDISFEVAQGEVIAVVGVSGVGKTTLVNLLSRFYTPTSGRILFDDTDIARATLRSIRGQIGLVTQDVLLFDDTVRANIAYGVREPDEERVLASARTAHVHEFAERMPQGYDTVIGEGGILLSGGQRQRLAIARAIYKDSVILILDEATSSLDSESEHLIKEALEEFMEGRTTFVIAHRLSTVERADRIIVLDRGRIQAMGTHAELVQTSEIYRGLYQRQFRDGGEVAREEEGTS